MNPKLTIKFLFIVPTLNAGSNIEKFSQLLLDQDYQYWRVIFVDGGSQAKDISSLNKIIKIDKRFSLVKESNKSEGIFGAMNQGFNLAKHDEFLFFWGADDFIYNNNILNMINKNIFEKINTVEEVDLFIFKARYYNNQSKKFTRFSFFPSEVKISKYIKDYFSFLLFFGFTPPHQSTLFTPTVRDKLSKYFEKYRLSADLNYFLSIARITNVCFKSFNKEIVTISDSGISSRNLYERLFNVFSIYFRYYGIFFFVPFAFRYFFKVYSKFRAFSNS